MNVLEYGAIHAPQNRTFEDRLLHIVNELEVLIDKYKPNVLSMESAFVAVNARSALVLGHVRGAILVACKKRGMSFAEFPPASVKQAVTGKGSASKEHVANMIYARLGIVPGNVALDATDALAIAWTFASPSPMANALPMKRRSRSRSDSTREWKKLIEKMGEVVP